MKYYARLENNIVKEVKRFADADIIDGDWKAIPYERQKMPVGIGFTYDEQNDIFLYDKPFDSWILNSDFIWEAPVKYPDTSGTTNSYDWDESTLSWKLFIPSL